MSKEFYYVNQIRNIDIEISNIEKKMDFYKFYIKKRL